MFSLKNAANRGYCSPSALFRRLVNPVSDQFKLFAGIGACKRRNDITNGVL
jgi:hypothetical protein